MEEVVSRSVQEDLEKVFSFFPALSEEQKSQYAQLYRSCTRSIRIGIPRLT